MASAAILGLVKQSGFRGLDPVPISARPLLESELFFLLEDCTLKPQVWCYRGDASELLEDGLEQQGPLRLQLDLNTQGDGVHDVRRAAAPNGQLFI